MILAKSAIRQAVFDGRIKILDDEGQPFPGWRVSFHFPYGEPYFAQETNWCKEGNDPTAMQPASIDLSLGRHWLVPKPNAVIKATKLTWWENIITPTYARRSDCHYLDTTLPIEYHETFADSFIVPARGFVLARTQEQIFVDKSIAAWVEGRSSVGRAGVFVQNAGWVDPNFQGTITLEIYNGLPHPVKLYKGTPCCQLVIPEVTGDNEEGYTGQYQGQIATKGSGLWKSVPKGEL
jgi:deoxycytidine triphosphate deaminase